MALYGRRARLLLEYEKLINLEKRSDFIKVNPVDVIEGMPPENYVITFRCRGISDLNEDKSPKFSEFHQVSIKLSSNFPNQEPYLKWLTPIWHPNIEHKEPHHVCTNNVQNWYSTKSLDDLVVKLGEMIQYRHYHAEWVAPFPLDKEAADWVVNYAEPRGLLSHEKPIDDRQILRPQKIKPYGSPPPVSKPTGKLIIGKKRVTDERIVSNSTIIHSKRITRETEVLNEQKTFKISNSVKSTGDSDPPTRRKGITLGLRAKQ